MTRPADILVVGAGPIGLTLALQAHDHGARVRIVDRRTDTFRPSRALIMHPRTLEMLRPLGVAEPLLAQADTDPQVMLHLGPRAIPVRLGTLDLPDTAFPHLTLVRQMDVETALLNALAQRGMAVERGVEVVEVEDGPTGARATLQLDAGTERMTPDYVAGCDGPESIVRRSARIGWPGGPYREAIVLADLEIDAGFEPGVAHAAIGRQGLLILFPLGERATWRLVTTRRGNTLPDAFGRAGPPVRQTELQAMIDEAGLEAEIVHTAWSAEYRVQHRVAKRFREGHLFLVGDAAHAYSPATGQGMNTGIQDAINLGWKLAFAPAATDREALLDSYDLERRPAVRQVLELTHVSFWLEASTDPLPTMLRALTSIGAPLIPLLLGRRRLIATSIRQVSQLRTAYPDSPLSVEGSPKLHTGPQPGQRVPDATVIIEGQKTRLHALLARPGIHVLLQSNAAPLEKLDLGQHVAIHRLETGSGAGIIAARPDGHVGFRSGRADAENLQRWLSRIGAMTRDETLRSKQ
ncbi:MAG: FAD-dependent monooxygenase [Chloroflexota bacterium]|nr:FAD-dependent monooxygenase [Chloroflexota bacterium]